MSGRQLMLAGVSSCCSGSTDSTGIDSRLGDKLGS